MRPTHSELPPYEMNGRVMPVMGSRLETTDMLIHACRQSHVVIPAASSDPVASGARSATPMPRYAMTRKSTITASVPASPSSSPRIAKIESV